MSTIAYDTSITNQPVLASSACPYPFDSEALSRKAVELTTREFIHARILPLVHVRPNGDGVECHCDIVQNTGTGRLTVRYCLGPENTIFGKIYSDDLGLRCHEISCALWEAEFNASRRFRVPQPIGFLPDLNLLLMRCVPGTPLGAAFAGHPMDLTAGSREAARWLITLHRSSKTMGTSDSDWDSLKLFRMTSRLIKAVAARPEKLDVVRDLMHRLGKRIADLHESRPFVLTHGRYHHDHVYLSADATAVIDLDRCRPSDPAKDAAEFVRVLRLTAFKTGYDMRIADEATEAFLSTYLSEMPEAEASIGCYWAAYVFHSLLGGLKKSCRKGSRSSEEVVEFCVREMMRALDFRQ